MSLKFKRNTWDEDRFENHQPRGGLLETRKSEEQEGKMANDRRSGRERKDSQKRETEAKHPKRRKTMVGWSLGSPGSEYFKEGVVHGGECFPEVKGHKDMDSTI